MTERYPSISPRQQYSYGPGTLLPAPGSQLVISENGVPSYEKYVGVQLHPHEFMSRAVAEVVLSDLAIISNATETNKVRVALKLEATSIIFDPPVSFEQARGLGSLVNEKMHQLANQQSRKQQQILKLRPGLKRRSRQL